MKTSIQQLIARTGDPDLSHWLESHSAPPFDGPPPDNSRKRNRAAAEFAERIRQDSLEIHASLMRDAERIMEMARPGQDWLVKQAFDDAGIAISETLQASSAEARCLQLFLTDRDEFEHAENRRSYFHLRGSRSKVSQYSTAPITGCDLEKEAVGSFENAVKTAYREHNGSGRKIAPPPIAQPVSE